MLVIQCASGWVGWTFQYVDHVRKAAVCASDGFTILYDPSPSQSWVQMVTALVAHSVGLQGAFVNSHWLQP